MALISNNLRFVWRSLSRNRAFTGAAVLSLALGIGANTAIFTLADQILLRVLPVKDPGRLVLLKWQGRFIGGTSRGGDDTFAYPMYAEMRDANPGVFTGIAARYQDSVDVTADGPAQRAVAEAVSGNYFDVLGVRAAIGRTLGPEDDKTKDAEPYVVLSYDYWQRRFGGDTSVLNRTIDVNGFPMAVVGVAQKGFRSFERMSPSDLFVPLAMKRAVTPAWDDTARRNSTWLKVFARLAPGVDPAAARNALQTVYYRSLENDLAAVGRDANFRASYLKNTVQLEGAAQGFRQTEEFFAKPLKVMLAMVGTLLLIACVNVANLLVTRSASRQKEIAVRLSLGATRFALVRLVMAESLILSTAGGLLGLVLSSWVVSFLLRMLPLRNIDAAIAVTPDWRIVSFAAGLSVVTALLFGLAPALHASSQDLASALKSESSATSMAAGQARLRRGLVAAQVTLSLVLLVGAGLFARSLYSLFGVNTGIHADRLLTFSVDPSLHRYTPERSHRLFVELQAGLQRIPGAAGASGAAFPILASTRWENTLAVEGYRPAEKEDMQGGWNQVMPSFFSTIGTPLIAGREFTERDSEGAPKVVIVSEAFVKRFFPGQNPLGRRVGFGSAPNMEIVGVVKDVKTADLRDNPKPYTWTPALQQSRPSEMTFYVRAAADPRALVQGALATANALDSSLPVVNIKTVEVQIDETHFIDRIFALLSSAFGLLATVLATIGLYGVTAYSVARRTQEIGIRIALGAARAHVVKLVFRESLLLTGAGLAAGVPLAFILSRFIESYLYGIRAHDPLVFGGAIAVIAVVTLLAGYLPARRAARIEPIRALRYE